MVHWAFQNDQFLPLDEVKLSLADSGFTFGATITDQCRTYRQQPFLLNEHLHRFFRSADLVQMKVPYSFDRIKEMVIELLDRCKKQHAAAEWILTWLLTPGEIGYFLGKSGGILQAQPHFLAYGYPLQADRFADYYSRGAVVMLARKTCSVPAHVLPPQVKQRSRLHWWMAEQEVKARHPQAQALLLDAQGHMTETASANILFVRHGYVLSPKRTNILNGISLQVTEAICRQEGIPFQETDLDENDIQVAEEACLCSTPYGIAPIGQIEDKIFPVHGTMFKRLQLAWQRYVDSQLNS